MAAARSSAMALAMLFVADGARMSKRSKAASSCGLKGDSAPSSQIVNGQPTTECEWRWQVQFLWDGSSVPFCGGTLISPEWVLTAAHCMVAESFDIRLGEYNISATSANVQIRKPAQIFKHPEYSDTWTTTSDYALVRLDSPVTINDCVGTACLPAGADVQAGTRCWITGWGTLQSGGSTPKILQEAEVTIISNEDCVTKFGHSSVQIDDSMICAQGRTSDGKVSDGCQGDSGGPLVCESDGSWTVYGATSWGRGCADANFPGVWARVHKEMDWVEDVLAGNAPTEAPKPTCPSEYSVGPDTMGGCQCHGGLRCYQAGVFGACPVFWGTSDTFFNFDCEDCICK